uniref:Uncharacterized protein n=1 Tax=Anguilla anguilla TaxID=7936 RepID=A0A0E9WNT8_ANGAN
MANYSQSQPCSCLNPTADSKSVDTCGSLWKYAMIAAFLLFTVQPTATLSSEETELVSLICRSAMQSTGLN